MCVPPYTEQLFLPRILWWLFCEGCCIMCFIIIHWHIVGNVGSFIFIIKVVLGREGHLTTTRRNPDHKFSTLPLLIMVSHFVVSKQRDWCDFSVFYTMNLYSTVVNCKYWWGVTRFEFSYCGNNEVPKHQAPTRPDRHAHTAVLYSRVQWSVAQLQDTVVCVCTHISSSAQHSLFLWLMSGFM